MTRKICPQCGGRRASAEPGAPYVLEVCSSACAVVFAEGVVQQLEERLAKKLQLIRQAESQQDKSC